MKATGGYLVRYALEQINVRYTFGIPGVHTTEIYDELNKSDQIEPILVTHEGGASFMADAISRTTDSIGTILTVPAAGTTHAASGIAEAYLDGVPMLIISGGIRRDSGKFYQLHQIEQEKMVEGFVKKYILVEKHEEIIPAIYEAYDFANDGEPGPVFVEIASNLLLLKGEVNNITEYKKPLPKEYDLSELTAIAENLGNSKKIGIYAGWGTRECSEELKELAELLNAPVSTTMQGLSVFPYDHPLHAGMGFGTSAVPAAENAFYGCDCMLAIGVRFAELATGSYGIDVPENLIHIDINKDVFDKNYKTKHSLEADAKVALKGLLKILRNKNLKYEPSSDLISQIKTDKKKYREEWITEAQANIVGPGPFFSYLNKKLNKDDFIIADDGNHTFLTAELANIHQSKRYICPTDFNAMGYCVPATIATKLANPESRAIGIVGDGGFLMTSLEILTAASNNLGAIFFVFHDGELGQISQFQKIPLNRKTCSVLSEIKIEGIALATGAKFLQINNNDEIESVIDEALSVSDKKNPVIVDVKIDYSKKTKFTKGVVKTNLARFPLGDKCRFIGRAVKRHILG